MTLHVVHWISKNREAQCQPNPAYPEGIDINAGAKEPWCRVQLPYPAPCIGAWLVKCDVCDVSVAVTAAGRVDDPRSLKVECRDRRRHDG